VSLCTQFGQVVHVVMMRSNNQALVEMVDQNAAVQFVKFYNQTPCQIRGRRVYARFSRHQELRRRGDGNPNRILLVTLQAEYSLQHLNIDIVYQIFSTYGVIDKIVMIKRDKGTPTSLSLSLSLASKTLATHSTQLSLMVVDGSAMSRNPKSLNSTCHSNHNNNIINIIEA